MASKATFLLVTLAICFPCLKGEQEEPRSSPLETSDPTSSTPPTIISTTPRANANARSLLIQDSGWGGGAPSSLFPYYPGHPPKNYPPPLPGIGAAPVPFPSFPAVGYPPRVPTPETATSRSDISPPWLESLLGVSPPKNYAPTFPSFDFYRPPWLPYQPQLPPLPWMVPPAETTVHITQEKMPAGSPTAPETSVNAAPSEERRNDSAEQQTPAASTQSESISPEEEARKTQTEQDTPDTKIQRPGTYPSWPPLPVVYAYIINPLAMPPWFSQGLGDSWGPPAANKAMVSATSPQGSTTEMTTTSETVTKPSAETPAPSHTTMGLNYWEQFEQRMKEWRN